MNLRHNLPGASNKDAPGEPLCSFFILNTIHMNCRICVVELSHIA